MNTKLLKNNAVFTCKKSDSDRTAYIYLYKSIGLEKQWFLK